MKSDTIIVGGGLSGLVCGIRLAQAGRKTVIISSGQSALHFSSGSMELLGSFDGQRIENPAVAMQQLPATHPYTIVGASKSASLADSFASLLADAGVSVTGSTERNHYRITPIGEIKPAWLTLADYPVLERPDRMPWNSVALVNLQGYLDMFPRFLERAFTGCGVSVSFHEVSIPELDHMRRSPSEMRATNMARTLTGEVLEKLASAINSKIKDNVDAILMPAVVGLFDSRPVMRLREMVGKPLFFLPTLPTSVPGVRTQILLRKRFQQLGGIYLLGDKVASGRFEGDCLRSINSVNFGKEDLEAEDFVLATGGFFSHGLVANPKEVYEPIFRLDVDAPADRSLWLDKDFYGPQPFMSFGVRHDDKFRAMRGGNVVGNLYVAGPIAGGCNPMVEECGAGVSAVTALAVSETINEKR